ncbi:ATP-binding cassette domain-containing protein [Arthrobacter sp. Sr33]
MKDLSIRIGSQYLVKGRSLTIPRSEAVALIGPSGSGKSLTAAALSGSLPGGAVVRGDLEIDGQEAALALAALGFLGLDADPLSPDWGLILAEGMAYVERATMTVFAPASALILASVLAVSASSIAFPALERRRKRTTTNISPVG